MRLIPFESSHIEAAAEILAARHRRDRAAEPLLPARFEVADKCAELIAATHEKDEVQGQVAFDGTKMVGYLLASAGDDIFGNHRWSGTEAISKLRPLFPKNAAGES